MNELTELRTPAGLSRTTRLASNRPLTRAAYLVVPVQDDARARCHDIISFAFRPLSYERPPYTSYCNWDATCDLRIQYGRNTHILPDITVYKLPYLPSTLSPDHVLYSSHQRQRGYPQPTMQRQHRKCVHQLHQPLSTILAIEPHKLR